MQPKISIVIPTHNRSELLKQVLKTLFQQTLDRRQFEIIVIDDGSNDGTGKLLADIQSKTKYNLRVYRQANLMAGSARNAGILKAQSNLILLIDDDILCDTNLVEQHLFLHQQNFSQAIVILGSLRTVRGTFDLIRTDDYPKKYIDSQKKYINPSYFRTANVSLKKEFLIQSGLFNPSLSCLQDTELAMRLKAMEMKLFYSENASAIHLEPVDSLAKVIANGKKYGRSFAELYNGNPLLIQDFAHDLNHGWYQLIHQPLQYFKNILRRGIFNRYTIELLSLITSKILLHLAYQKISTRFCKEIWSYYHRREFYQRRKEIQLNQS